MRHISFKRTDLQTATKWSHFVTNIWGSARKFSIYSAYRNNNPFLWTPCETWVRIHQYNWPMCVRKGEYCHFKSQFWEGGVTLVSSHKVRASLVTLKWMTAKGTINLNTIPAIVRVQEWNSDRVEESESEEAAERSCFPEEWCRV